MEPTRNSHATLVDLLDRALDKGLVLYADIIVSVAGIPLIGVNLRAALAGMETMLKYGVMTDWDARTRAWEREHRKEKEISVTSGEEIILETLGSYHYSQGIYTAWRMGRIYLTDNRLILYHPSFEEVIFETPLEKIKGLAMEREEYFTERKARENLCLLLETGNVARLHAVDTRKLRQAMEQEMARLGVAWQEMPTLPVRDERAASFLTGGEEIACRGKMWYLMEARGIFGGTWKPGHLYITNKRVCWWYDSEQRIAFEVPLNEIAAAVAERRDLSPALTQRDVLDVIYQNGLGKQVASFSGDELWQWEKVLNRIISQPDLASAEEFDTCPQCGQEAPALELLEKGCASCGWVSPRLRSGMPQMASSG